MHTSIICIYWQKSNEKCFNIHVKSVCNEYVEPTQPNAQIVHYTIQGCIEGGNVPPLGTVSPPPPLGSGRFILLL